MAEIKRVKREDVDNFRDDALQTNRRGKISSAQIEDARRTSLISAGQEKKSNEELWEVIADLHSRIHHLETQLKTK